MCGNKTFRIYQYSFLLFYDLKAWLVDKLDINNIKQINHQTKKWKTKGEGGRKKPLLDIIIMRKDKR